MSENLVELTIDGRPVSVPKGTLVVEAARQLGIEIPVYCYHPKMKPVGACRVCAVEVEGQRRPIMTACTTEVMPNMAVNTRSENAIAAREGILEFLLINHPLDCPVCDRGGECDLQDFTLRYGPATTRFVEAKRHFAKSKQIGQNVILDRERCIMCQRCVRFCSEIAMEEGLVIVDRGYRSEIGAFEGRSYDSQYSGNTIELCPVGALTAKSYRFNARPWEQQHYAGVCNHCSVGCNITVDVRFDEVVRFRSRCNDEIDDGWLCDRGRYGHDHIHADNRFASPMLRNEQGDLETVTWERALAVAAEKLGGSGAETAVLLGSQLSAEDGHAWLRLTRGVLKSNNITHQHADEADLGNEDTDHASGRVVGCDDAEIIVCLGCDPSKTHPGIDLRIKKGLRHKAKLVVLNDAPAMVGLADYQALGEPSALWEKLTEAIDSLPEEKPAGLKIPHPRPWEAGGATSNDWDAIAGLFRYATRVMVITAGNLTDQRFNKVSASLAARGWATAPHGLLHLRTGANSLGLDQIGCLPSGAPGGVTWKENDRYKAVWGELSTGVGKDFAAISQRGSGTLVAVGCDPLAENGAKKPGYLIACSMAPNVTSEQADLIFPLSSWLESHGTYVSTDGSVQMSRQSILPVGESQPAWAIASALCKALTKEDAPYKTTRQVFAEIGQLNPAFLGQSYRDFESPGTVHWSYPQQADLGMPRPDLSAIPVSRPDTPMWMPTLNTGSKVERAARITRGDTAPSVPGQDDPRKIAALLGLAEPFLRHSAKLESPSVPKKEGYVPLRVMVTSGAQPAGPTPAQRHQRLGVAPHVHVALPGAVVAETPALEEAVKEEAVVSETAASAATKESTSPKEGGLQPDAKESVKAESMPEDKIDEVHGESNVAVVNNVTEDKAAGDGVSEGKEPEVRKLAGAEGVEAEVEAAEDPDDGGEGSDQDLESETSEPTAKKPDKTASRSKKKPKKAQSKSGKGKKS